jgi:hypothetical protein
MADPIVCTPKHLPKTKLVDAARIARQVNPLNHPHVEQLTRLMPAFKPTPQRIAVVTKKYWGARGVKLTVGFLDGPEKALRARILEHMNAWGKTANVQFVASQTDPHVRIARVEDDGYWSYVGTDILSIAAGEPTMNLEGFTMNTSEAEFHRVVRHETGHTLGFPHEHMRRELVNKIDPKKAIEYFGRTQGWTAQEVRQQVLTPIEDGSVLGTEHADPNSIMCYQIPGSITKNRKPIVGGLDIDASDAAFAARIYPKTGAPPKALPKLV